RDAGSAIRSTSRKRATQPLGNAVALYGDDFRFEGGQRLLRQPFDEPVAQDLHSVGMQHHQAWRDIRNSFAIQNDSGSLSRPLAWFHQICVRKICEGGAPAPPP